MGDSACLMHGFSYASAIPNEAKQGNPMHALGESISFGRFTTESLSWEKWSSFSSSSSHRRYVEEAERYARPGSVAQKKAFFEAHYKRIAAQKAAALAEQENVNNSNNVGNGNDLTNHGNYLPTQDQEIKVCCVENEEGKENGVIEAPVREKSSDEFCKVEGREAASGSETSGTSQMEKPLLKNAVEDEESSSATSKKKSALSSFKSSINRKTSKALFTPVKPVTPHFNKEHNNVTRKSNVDSMDKNKSTQKSMRALINMVPTKEPDKLPNPNERAEIPVVPPLSSKTQKDCSTPLKTPVATAKYGTSKRNIMTPCTEDRSRNKTPINTSALGSKTSGPKWHILSAVCPKSLTTYRKKLQSPTLSTPFILRTEERAARRKQKLEEKFNAKEAPKVQLQTTLREKAGNEFRKLRQSFCFKARPLPDFYKEREIPKNQTKKSSLVTTTTYLIKKQGTVSMPPPPPPPTFLAKKNGASKSILKKKIVIPRPEKIDHENKSPNIIQG